MTATTPQTKSLDAALKQAIAHHQAGRLREAEQLYRTILQSYPSQADANHNLGVLAGLAGQPAAGLPYLKTALALNPSREQYALSYANALLSTGQAGEALKTLQAAAQRGLNTAATRSLRQKAEDSVLNNPATGMPTHAEMDQLMTLFNAGRYLELENRTHLLLERYPDSGFAWNVLGVALQAQGKSKEALPALRKAAELLPDNAGVHNSLGNTLQSLGQLSDATGSYRRALEFKPDFAEAHNNLGNILHELGQLDDAAASHHRALAIKPDFAEAHIGLGNALRDLRQLGSAIESYHRALAIKPDFAVAHNNLGNALRDIGQLEDAVTSFHRALQINPYYAMAHNNLGNALHELGQIDSAVASHYRALEIQPDYVEAHTTLLFCLSHSEAVDAQTLFAEHCRFGKQFETPLQINWPRHDNSTDPERRLQVGFVSGDLCDHVVANFIEPVLVHLANFPQLSLHAYYNHAVDDAVTQRLKKHLTHWHSIVGLSDAALAQKIREDGIDILIDLSGHTAKNRLLTFARKPAPVQASWMGYAGTTGLTAMDYYLTDRYFLPPGQFDSQFTEKLVRLPASAPFRPFDDAPPVNSLPALGNGYMTFGSFNRLGKLNPAVIALWSQILRTLPDARMVLGGMPHTNENSMLIEWFARESVARERLTFHPNCQMKDYLGLHHQVDICLDTFPYPGGTTACHALWMGVPTLTLAGSTPVSSVGATLPNHMGLEAFVAHNKMDFVEKGLYWADHLAELAEIRGELRARFEQSAVGRPDIIAAALERALRTMWQRWCAGLPAESFEVPVQSEGDTMPGSNA